MTTKNSDRWHSLFQGDVILLRDIEILVVLTDIDVHNLKALLEHRRDSWLLECVFKNMTIEAPVSAENQQHALVFFVGSSDRLGNLLLRISIGRIKVRIQMCRWFQRCLGPLRLSESG